MRIKLLAPNKSNLRQRFQRRFSGAARRLNAQQFGHRGMNVAACRSCPNRGRADRNRSAPAPSSPASCRPTPDRTRAFLLELRGSDSAGSRSDDVAPREVVARIKADDDIAGACGIGVRELLGQFLAGPTFQNTAPCVSSPESTSSPLHDPRPARCSNKCSPGCRPIRHVPDRRRHIGAAHQPFKIDQRFDRSPCRDR